MRDILFILISLFVVGNILKEMGLQPNMERLAAEFCVNCNKSDAARTLQP